MISDDDDDDGNQAEIQLMEHYRALRKPSREQLESVRLRPTYERFPSPKFGRSPIMPQFHIPKYSSIDSSPAIFTMSPLSPIMEGTSGYNHSGELSSIISATLSSMNYFVGVSDIINLSNTL